MEWFKKRKWRAVTTLANKAEEGIQDDGLETEEEKRERWRSIRIIYFTMFLMSLGFSIILTGVWPFLDKLDPSAGKEFMGYVVAANPLGQMLFSPLVGWWGNKAGSIRVPLLTTIAMFTVSSGMYAALEVFEEDRKYWMLWSRFFVGMSSANIAAARSYLSAATRIKERTGAISIVSLMQVLGFVIGPCIQAVVTPLGTEGISLGGAWRLNMYTATGWINVLLGVVNFILFLPSVFKERTIAAKEVMVVQGKQSEKETWKAIKPDYLVSWSLIIAFFILVFNFVLVETLATPVTMDQFSWTKTESLRNTGFIMSIGAIVACASFLVTKKLSEMFEERKLMMAGFILTMSGTLCLIPWGSAPPKLALPENYTLPMIRELMVESNLTMEEIIKNLANGTDILGCPVATQAWCEYAPAMTVTQFVIAYIFASIGYPLGVSLIQTIFSKILGPRPQGVWMGLMTVSGCFSRVLGPVFVSYVYSKHGPTYTFCLISAGMIVYMTWICIINKRLIPPALLEKPPIAQELQNLTKSNGDNINGAIKSPNNGDTINGSVKSQS